MTKRLTALVGPCLLAMIAVACGDEGFWRVAGRPHSDQRTADFCTDSCDAGRHQNLGADGATDENA